MSLALAAGMFSVVPVAHGMPTVDTSPGAHADYTTKPVAVGDTMEVQGNRTNNVIDWKDFSIENGKTVAFQDVGGKAANYMNIVTGHATSNIEGTMTNRGDIYLINPNGVIFGATAQVNVGNLYVSTREASQVDIAAFRGDDDTPVLTTYSPSDVGDALTAAALTNGLKADVVSLIDNQGYVAATTVVMEGKNIRFLNAAQLAKQNVGTNDNPAVTTDALPSSVTGNKTDGFNVTAHPDAANVIFRANDDGYIHVGNGRNLGTGKSYANSINYTAQNLDQTARIANSSTNGENVGVVNYALIHNGKELQDINGDNFATTLTYNNTKLAGNYMLANDIVIDNAANALAKDKMSSAIGTAANPFTGKFDGNFYTVSDLHLLSGSSESTYLGLFGHTSGARIENVGVKDFQLNGRYAGGVVGYAGASTTILNVWNEGGTGAYVGTNGGWGLNAGGLVGDLVSSWLKNSYNSSVVNGAGLVGQMTNGHIENSYNVGQVTARGAKNPKIYGLVYNINDDASTIENAYTASKYIYGTTGTECMADNKGTYTNSYIIDSPDSYKINKATIATSAKTLSASAYSAWSIDSEGGSNSAWRIYEGYSLPLLTSFMKAKGTVAVDYSYNGELTQGTTTTGIDNLTGKTGTAYTGYNTDTDPAINPYKVYDAKKVLAENATAASAKYYGANATSADVTLNNRKDVYAPTTDVHGNPVASSFALFSGGQQGYDLYGNNFKINQRTVTVSAETLNADKIYDGDTQKTYEGSALASTISGLIPSDTSVTLGGSITYTYADKNVGEDKAVEISHTALSLTGDGSSNYAADFSNIPTNTTGTISARKIAVSLVNPTGIDKTYDGSTVVRNENTTKDYTASGNIQFGASTDQASDMDTDALLTLIGKASEHVTLNKDSAAYTGPNVAFDGEGAVTSQDVTYTFSKTGNDAGNYVFTNADGTDLATAGQITGTGTIGQRTIESFGTAAVTTPYKTYDGLNSMTVSGSGSSVTIDDDDLVSATDAEAGTTLTGLLVNDVQKVKFKTSGTVYFYDANGNLTSSASTSGLGTAATKASFDVALDTDATGYDATVAKNYTWTAGAERTGNVIGKRDVTVALKQSSGIDKVYDGNENVTGSSATAGNFATENYQITSGSLVADATTSSTPTIGISGTPTYSSKDVEYEADGVTPKAKSIAYTIAISGAAAGNYNLNSTNSATVELAATGTITPAPLTVTFADTTKMFDTTATATTITPEWTGLLGTDTADNTQLGGQYVAKDAQGAYQDAVNVGTYDPAVDNAAKAVKYTGIAAALGTNAGNYTISGNRITESSTVYGRGYITARKISLEQLKSYLDPKGNLTKTYDATPDYTHDMVTANNLAASDYLQVDNTAVANAISQHDLMDGAATDIQTVINDKLTIAEAVYRNADGTNAVNASDTPYTNVSMTFNMDGTGKTQDTGDQKYYITVGNYDFEWAESFSDATSGTPAITGRTGTITPKGLTVTVADATKIYDGTQTVKANGVVVDTSSNTFKSWFTFSGMVDDETVTLANGASATYDTKNADADGSTSSARITYSDLALADGTNGGKASNYKIVDSTGATISEITGIGTINKRNVTISDYGAAAATKTYDGDADVEAYALTFANGNDSTDWAVLAADGITKNADGSQNTTGVISYDLTGTYLPTGSQTEGQGKDVLRDSTNRATILEKDVEYTGTALTNLYGGNYNVTLANGGTYNSTTGKLTVTNGGKINPAQIQVNNDEIVAAAANRVYDGTKSLENPAIDYLTFNNAELNAHRNDLTVTGTYDSKNAGGRTVTYTISMDANNYDLSGDIYDAVTGTATKMGSGTISKKTIYGVVGATASTQKSTISKVYDGYTTVEDADATTAKTWLTTNLAADGTGAVAITDEDWDLDDVSILTTGVTLAYKDANVATSDANDKVTYSGLALTGEDAENYTLGNTKDAEDKYVAYGYGSITPKSIAFAITVADGAYKKDYDGGTGLDGKLDGVDTTNSTTLTGTVTAWWNGVRAAGDNTTFGNAFETDTSGNLVGYYGVWNPTTKTFTENPNVWADKANNKKTSDVYYGLTLKGDAAQNYELLSTGGTTGATINVNNTTIQDTVYFQDAMKGKGEIKPLAISMEKVKNEWGTFEKVYDGSTSVEGYLVSGAATPTKEQQLTIYYDENGNGVRDKDANGNYTENVTITYSVTGANYEDANAGNGKNIAYTGFSFQTADLDNFAINATDLANKYKNGAAATTTTTGNIARRLLNVTPGTDNVKIYDGSEVLVAAGTAYTASMTDATNPNATGLVVGHDNVSVTYAANFDDKNASVDPDAAATDQGWTAKTVTYTYTLADDGNSANYTLVSNPADDDAARTTAKNTTGGIKRREVYVDFVQDKGTGLDKVYDNTSLIGENIASLITLKPVDINAKTGVVDNTVTLDTGNVTAHYVDKNGAASVDSDAKLGITTREVYFQNLNLTGTGKENYVVKAKNHDGQVKKTATDPTKTEQTLIGTGSIARRKIEVAVTDTKPTKEYDRTTDVLLSDGTAYVSNGGRTLTKDDPYLKIADGVVDVSDGKLPGDETAAYADANVTVESAFYHDRNAQDGLGVTYKLKVNNQNYELVRYALDAQGNKHIEGTGDIKKKTIAVIGATSPLVKTYDGNNIVQNTPNLVTDLFGNNVYDEDKATLLTNVSGTYDSADTGADADKVEGNLQGVTVTYDLNGNGSGKNYQFATGSESYTNNQGGRIDRAQLTLTPNNVTYSAGDNIPADGYAGSVTGWKNGDTLADGYDVTFKRDPQNLSTAPGNYQLLGYVNGDVAPTANGMVYYNNLGNSGNYYFVTAPNTALHVEAKADVADVVERDTIADKKFTPDDYSYNRMSQDEDLTRLNRESQASVQYSEKGVNTDESSQGGLISSMDIQGSGSVVNLNGAVIQTSAVPEQPEEIAAEAALPVSEASEADFSSIDVENTDESGSQSVLEILTNASNNAENRGTSIVIHTMDEDEEEDEAEAEKSRRALVVDRSNIGIETLGDAVNLDQMIG